LRLFAWLPVVGLLVGAALPAQQPAPLSKGDVLELIAAGVPSARLAGLVEERGISFEVTPEAAEELRKAGASEELLVALKLAAKLRKEHAAQPSATLNIESEPGSADIYLSDEPKGTTSHEGKLRLTGLAPGTYRLRVSATGFQTWEKEIVAKPGEVQTVTVVLAAESGEKRAAAKAIPAAPEAPKPKVVPGRPVEEIVAAAKSLCIVLEGQTLPVIKSELSKKLHEWGKLALVASPDKADLILRLTQTGRLGQGIEGHQAVATLVERETDVELWSSTQGGSWTWSGWNPAWVGRALAEEFIKFYDTSMNARKRQN
jgi:hypothetical protein